MLQGVVLGTTIIGHPLYEQMNELARPVFDAAESLDDVADDSDEPIFQAVPPKNNSEPLFQAISEEPLMRYVQKK